MYTIEEIEKMLAEISPWPWGWCYDGLGDYTIGHESDPQGKSICNINDHWHKKQNDLIFISKSPEIVSYLLEEERWQRDQVWNSRKQSCYITKLSQENHRLREALYRLKECCEACDSIASKALEKK